MEREQPYIDKVYNNFLAISGYLSSLIPEDIDDKKKDSIIGEKGDFNSHNKKFIIILAASYYEKQVMKIIKDYIGKTDDIIMKNLALRAIDRGYSKFFDFKKEYANALNQKDTDEKYRIEGIYYFFANFGKECKDHCKKEINNNEYLQEAIAYFLTINYWRNKIVHGEYENSIVKNLPRIEAIHERFTKSKKFINWLPKVLEDCQKSQKNSTSNSEA